MGEMVEARRLYEQSLQLKRELSDKEGAAITEAQIALLEEQEGNFTAALSLIGEAERLFGELRSPMREQARRERERMEKKGQPVRNE